LILIATVWFIALAALVLWLGTARVDRVAIGGGPAGSEALALTEAIATVLNEKDLNLRLVVYETGGSQQNIALLEKGRIDLGEIQGDTPTSDRIMGVTALYQDAYHLIVREGSGIQSFADLAGHRVATPPASSGQFNSFWFLAAHFGIDDQLPRALPMSEDAANFAMELGQVDAVFRVRAPGNDIIRSLIGDRKLRLIPIEQAQALALKQPVIAPGIIPRGSYRGSPPLPENDLKTAIVDRLLVARADLDQDVVYRITRAIYENRSEILDHTLLAGFIGPLPDDSNSVIIAHPGARSYFDREKPGILQRNARLVSALLYTIAIVVSALLALRTHWIRSRRLRMHDFNRRLMDLATLARSDSDVAALQEHKNALMDILEEVVSDLERERVSQDEFEHFSFTWQAVDALLRDRLLLTREAETSTAVTP
jgi:TRAP transporter TAXI family solute receptor